MARNSNSTLFIPAGKEVKIFTGSPNDFKIPVVKMILNDKLSFSIGGEYSTVVDNNTSTLQSMLSSVINWIGGGSDFAANIAGLVTGLNSKLAYQVYTSGKPLSFSLNCSLVAVTNAYKEVIEPIRTIQKVMSPTENEDGFLTALPGIGVIEQLTNGEYGLKKDNKYGYIKIGNLSFFNVLFKTMTTTFSTEVDTTGYPIEADVSLDIETSQMVTETTIDKLYGISKSGNNIEGFLNRATEGKWGAVSDFVESVTDQIGGIFR